VESLYPSATAAEIDDLLDISEQIERHSAAWIEPTCQSVTADDREAAKTALTALLHSVETRIEGADFVVGNGVTLADIALASSLLPLYQDVLGQDVQATTPHVVRWLQGLLAHPHFHDILGEFLFSL
jgi:glutathione S-transferase